MSKIKQLQKPEIDVAFDPNPDGSYSVRVVIGGGNSLSQTPLREVAIKHIRNLEAAVKNELLTEGVSFRPNKLAGELSGEAGAKGNIGGKAQGGINGEVEPGKIAKLGVKAHGGLNGSGEASTGVELDGKLGFKLSFDIHPGRNGLPRELKDRVEAVLHEKSDRIFNDWAKTQLAEGGARVPSGNGKDVIEINKQVLQDYVDSQKPGLQRVLDKLRSDAGPTIEDATNTGFADAGHRYHGMYRDALAQLDPLSGKLDGRAAGDVAAALVAGAANAGFDPQKPITVAAGTREGTVFAIQGDPSSPASRSAMVDTANLQVPDAAQIARLQAPAAAEAPQLDAQRQGGPARA